MFGLSQVKKHLENGLKIKDWKKGKEEDDLIDYSVTLSNGHCIEWSVSPGFNTSVILDTDRYLNDKSNHVDTSPPPPKKEVCASKYRAKEEKIKATVKEQLALVKQATDNNYKIKDWYTEESGGKSWYKLELTNELTYSILYKKDCVEDIAEVSSFINKHRTSTIVNLPNGDFVKPKKDAPFYQGMTKEETIRSLSAFRESSGMTTIFSDYYVFGWVLVLVANKMDSLEYVYKKNKGWMFLGKNTLYYKELILESQTEKKELERKEERFEEIEAKYLEGIKDVGYHLDWLKDMKLKNPNWYKDHVRREYMGLNFGHRICETTADKMEKETKELLDKVDEDIVNSLDKSGEDVDNLNDGILAKISDVTADIALAKKMFPNTNLEDLSEGQMIALNKQKEINKLEKEAEKQKDLYLKRLAAEYNPLTFAEAIVKEVREQVQRDCEEYQKRVNKFLDDYTNKVSGKFDLEAENINDGIFDVTSELQAEEVQRKKEEAEMKTKSQFKEPKDWLLGLIREMYPNAKCIWVGESGLEPQLTPKDLIQAAKDELVGRVSGQYRCSPRTRKQESKLNAGWAGCIQYLEFLTEIQDKPNVK